MEKSDQEDIKLPEKPKKKQKTPNPWAKANPESIASYGLKELPPEAQRKIDLFLANHERKHKAGRPTSYDPEIHGKALLNYASQGKSLTSAATNMGIHRDLLYAWRDSIPEFRDIFAQARSMIQAFYEERLNELHAFKTGTEQTRLEMGAINLIMKTWFREEYQDQPQVIVAQAAPTVDSQFATNIKEKLNELESKIRNGHNKS